MSADEHLEQLIRPIVEKIVEELQPVLTSPEVSPLDLLDDKGREKLRLYLLLAHKPFLTKKEAALYLDVSERSISEWGARPPDQNPFPLSYAGGDPRAKRERIDEWAEREGARQRLKLAS